MSENEALKKCKAKILWVPRYRNIPIDYVEMELVKFDFDINKALWNFDAYEPHRSVHMKYTNKTIGKFVTNASISPDGADLIMNKIKPSYMTLWNKYREIERIKKEKRKAKSDKKKEIEEKKMERTSTTIRTKSSNNDPIRFDIYKVSDTGTEKCTCEIRFLESKSSDDNGLLKATIQFTDVTNDITRYFDSVDDLVHQKYAFIEPQYTIIKDAFKIYSNEIQKKNNDIKDGRSDKNKELITSITKEVINSKQKKIKKKYRQASIGTVFIMGSYKHNDYMEEKAKKLVLSGLCVLTPIPVEHYDIGNTNSFNSYLYMTDLLQKVAMADVVILEKDLVDKNDNSMYYINAVEERAILLEKKVIYVSKYELT